MNDAFIMVGVVMVGMVAAMFVVTIDRIKRM